MIQKPYDPSEPERTTLKVTNVIEGQSYFFRVFSENISGRSKPTETDKPLTVKASFGEWLFRTFKQFLLFYIQKGTVFDANSSNLCIIKFYLYAYHLYLFENNFCFMFCYYICFLAFSVAN